MNAYSEDLRKKIVEAVERGMPKIEAAKTFGVGISSVKRYVAAAREGRSLAPKKRPGSKPKLDEGARRLLEADLEERPAATLPERRDFLRWVRGVGVSDSTVSRVPKRMGWTRKKIGGCEREGRVLESRLAGDGRWPSQEDLRRAAGVRGRVLHQHLVGTPVRLVSARRASALVGATQLGGERDALGVHERERDGPFLGGRRPNHQGSFRDLSGATLSALTLSGSGGGDGQPPFSQRREGQGAHRSKGCELIYLPPYSPNLNPIEEAFAKLKALLRKAGARTREALIEAMGRALEAVTAQDACGFFEHRGYRAAAQLL
jgi:transposase